MSGQIEITPFTPAQIASVLGHYDVLAIVSGPPGEVDEKIGELAAISDESVLGERYGWVLKSRERVAVLSTIGEELLPRLLEETEVLAFAGDGYAEALRAALAGRLPSSNTKGQEALSALKLAMALPSLAPRHGVFAQEISRIENTLQLDRERASLDFVISNRQPLVGRSHELSKLVSFATKPTGQETIVLSGDAGVGKSALLATLIRTLTQSREAITVVLDFDGPQLASAEPAEFLREFSRRLASAATSTDLLTSEEKSELTANMKSLRSRLRSRSSEKGNVQRISSEEQYRNVDAYAVEAFESLPRALRSTPILLVLDTFEVALAAGEVEIDRLLTIVMLLRLKFNIPSLRAIVAGRSLAGQLASWAKISQGVLAPETRWLVLSALKPRAAEKLIANLDRGVGRFSDPVLRRKAAKIAGYYPLSLKLIYRATRDLRGEQLSKFLDDLKGGERFVDEVNTQFLHTRILGRLEDPSLRKLAAPGLLLRMVSPDLIRLVLARPCGLGEVTVPAAWNIYEKLKKTWLVDHPGDAFSRHRDDLRRQMVSAITAQDPQKADELHRAAASFYLAGPAEDDPAMAFWKSLSPEVRNTEGTYHAALAGDRYPQAMSQQEARSLQKNLGLDVELLPDGWIAVIRAATGNISTLTNDQVATLSGSLRDEAVAKEINRLLAVNDAESAAKLVNLRSAGYDDGFTPHRPSRSIRSRSAGLSRRDVQQDILVAWANAAINEAALAFEQLVELEPDRVSGLMAALPDAVVEDSSSLSAGVLAASLKRPWKIAPQEGFLSNPVSPHLAIPYLAARMLLSDDTSFSTIIGELRDGRLLRHALDEREMPFDHHRLKSWTVAMRMALGDGLHHSVTLSKEFLDLRTIMDLGAPTPTVTENTSVGLYHTARAIEVLRLGSTSARIENIYRAEGQFTFSVDEFGIGRTECLKALRGLTPELHQPTAFLLRRAPADQLIEFLRGQSTINPLWPRDLAFEKERPKRAFPEQETLSVVVTCDRLRLLPVLLEWLVRFQDQASDLLAIHHHITARLFAEFDFRPSRSGT